MKILIVDDEPGIRYIVARFLRDDGHELGFAADGMEGLEKFRSAEWDIVITDNDMPRLRGDALAIEIRREKPGTGVIMASGTVTPVNQVGRTLAAVDIVVPKPFNRAALRSAIAMVTERIRRGR